MYTRPSIRVTLRISRNGNEKDLAAMVLRDRNHPSIIMWSIGNEIDYPNDPYRHPLFGEMTGNNDKISPLRSGCGPT